MPVARIAVAAGVLAGGIAWGLVWRSTTDRRPNLLLVTIDTLRADALSVYGIRHLDMPYTSQTVWSAIQSAKGGQA